MSDAQDPNFDARALRDACGLFATGVNVIATRLDGRDHGMTANAFMSVSLDPPLIAISVAAKAKMSPLLRESRRFAVSVLPEGFERLAWHFAGRPDPQFASAFVELDGLPSVRDATAVFSADLVQEVEAGDHAIFIGRVRALRTQPHRPPLLFHKGGFGAVARASLSPARLSDPLEESIW